MRLSTLIRHPLFAALLAFALATPAMADDNAVANRLFVAAVQAWNAAEALTEEDPAIAEARLDLLRDTAENLRRIIAEYPGADLAVRLVIGETVGPLSLPGVEAALAEAEIAHDCMRAPTRDCVLAEALATARSISTVEWRDFSLGEIVAAQAQLGLFDDARVIARGMDESRWRALALARIGAAQGSPDLFDEALDAAPRGIGFVAVERAETLMRIAGVQARAGYHARALDTARAIDPDRMRATAIALVAAAQGSADLFAEALDNLSEARGLAVRGRDEALLQIAAAKAGAGRITQAMETASAITDAGWRASAFAYIAAAQAQAEQFDEALAIAREIEDARWRAFALAQIAAAPGGPDLFDEALDLARGIDGRRARGTAFQQIAAAQAEGGHLDAALATARGIGDLSGREFALRQVASALAKAGRVAEALAIAHGIEDLISRARAFGEIAAALPE